MVNIGGVGMQPLKLKFGVVVSLVYGDCILLVFV